MKAILAIFSASVVAALLSVFLFLTDTAEAHRDCEWCPELILVPAGSFMYGRDFSEKDEETKISIKFDEPFFVSKFEVGHDLYDRCIEHDGCPIQQQRYDLTAANPALAIHYEGAIAFAKWLSAETGESYRLPTDAEWEYFARAGTDTRFWWGEDWRRDKASCLRCGGMGRSHFPPVRGAFSANPFGIYDTAGGVGEWVLDCHSKEVLGGVGSEQAGHSDCRLGVLRGGAWNSMPIELQSGYRSRISRSPDIFKNWGSGRGTGFRVVRDLSAE